MYLNKLRNLQITVGNWSSKLGAAGATGGLLEDENPKTILFLSEIISMLSRKFVRQ